MGFLDKFKKKKDEQEKTQVDENRSAGQEGQGRRIKKYTSDGKPVYD